MDKTETSPIFNNVALTVFQDNEGRWLVGKVPVNTLTGEAGQLESIVPSEGDFSRGMAVERFKILVVESGLLG